MLETYRQAVAKYGVPKEMLTDKGRQYTNWHGMARFEQAGERCAFWITYYNHKRPHQGIGGLCPADHFFEIAHDLKKTLQRNVEENVLELALRGRPKNPFYVVGRMGGQSVVIRAEKGKFKMLVDDADQEKELVYDARKDIDLEDKPTNPQSIK